MPEPAEIFKVDEPAVSCDGGKGPLGHPRVYLNIKKDVGHIDCPYCGRRFVLEQNAKADA